MKYVLKLLSYLLTLLFTVALAPYTLLFHLARLTRLPFAKQHNNLVPDYRQRQLAEALNAYGFALDNEHYSLREYISITPDKFFYFFTDTSTSNEVLVLLVEDYISGLEYVKDCFSKDLDAKLAKLHAVIQSKNSREFEERKPVKSATTYRPPQDWDELSDYAIDFPPFYFGFLASVTPNDSQRFWDELHERLDKL